MRRLLSAVLVLSATLTTGGGARGQQETSHYPPGIEGLKIATLPPPGTYLKVYNFWYSSTVLKDRRGNTVPASPDLDVFFTAPRLIRMTEHKILGADYGLDIAVPFVNVDLNVAAQGVSQSRFGLGDIYCEPLVLAWHTKRFDFGLGAGVWVPTGDYSSYRAVNPGKGFWTGMFSAGATYYFDPEKTWHCSALARYQTNTRKRDIHLRPGDDFHIEGGFGKTVCKGLDIGVTGYAHWQVTDDSGSDVKYDASVHDRFCALGPEILYFYAPAKMSFSLRYQRQFAVRDRTEGHTVVFSFVKIF